MPLSSQMVDSLFRRLFVRYGNAWATKWAGIPEDDIRADWMKVIGNFDPDAIRYGLENLPPFVPTAHQFRELCLRAPEKPLELLPPPKETPEQKEKVRKMLAQVRAKLTGAA